MHPHASGDAAPPRARAAATRNGEGTVETPSSVMFQDLKTFGRVSNRDAALLLLNPDARYGGASLLERVLSNRSFLSREVVHADPRDVVPSRFCDLAPASLTLAGRVADALGPADPYARIAEHYLGPAADAMRQALDDNELDGQIYANALAKIAQAGLPTERSRAVLCLMLFVATGCLQDPRAAAALVEAYATTKLSSGLYTTETSVGPGYARSLEEQGPQGAGTTLGLMRVAAEGVRLPAYRLSTAPEGTVIGTLAPGADDITDVERDVSRLHLRIWRDHGRWWAQGLGSTNGTTLVSGATGRTSVVEPPRGLREPGVVYPPKELFHGDTLCLGATTRFVVLRVAEGREAHR